MALYSPKSLPWWCAAFGSAAGDEFGHSRGAFGIGFGVLMARQTVLPDRGGAFIGGFAAIFGPLAVVRQIGDERVVKGGVKPFLGMGRAKEMAARLNLFDRFKGHFRLVHDGGAADFGKGLKHLHIRDQLFITMG